MALKPGRPSGRTNDHVEEAKSQVDDEVRLNVRMQRAEYRQIKRYAVDHDLSVSDIVRQALGEYMSSNSHE